MRSINSGISGASTGDLVEVITACTAELAARPAPESAALCFEQAQTLGGAADLMEAAIASRVAAAERGGEPQRWGHPSTVSWLRTSLAMRHSRAEDRAILARQLGRLTQVAKRLAANELSYGYASVIAGAVRRLDDDDAAKAETILLELVDAGCSVKEVTTAGERITTLIAERDGTAAEPEDGRRGERQWWTMHRTSGGRAMSKGLFSPELAALIRAKIEPLAQPLGPEDTRDHAQRMADALQMFISEGDHRWDPILILQLRDQLQHPTLATATAPGETAPPDQPAAPGTLPADSPAQAAAPDCPDARRRTQPARLSAAPPLSPDRSPTAPRLSPDWPIDGTQFTARLADGTPIPTRRAREILLNAGYSALVLGADGHPLYLGRTVRCATPHQRRVLIARYPTCVVQGCDIPGALCQVDHVTGWAAWGQPTSTSSPSPADSTTSTSTNIPTGSTSRQTTTTATSTGSTTLHTATRPSSLAPGRQDAARSGRLGPPAPQSRTEPESLVLQPPSPAQAPLVTVVPSTETTTWNSPEP